MAACTVVVDGNDRVVIEFRQCTDYICGTLLHFRVGTLNGVQFDAGGVLAGFHGGNGAATHSDAVIVTTQQHHFLAHFGITFQCIDFFAETDTAGQHDDFIVSEFFRVLSMFKRKQRTTNKRLTKFVAEIAGSVGSLDQNLFGRLVQPGAFLHGLLPLAVRFGAGVGSHVNSRACDGQGSLTTTQAVADFTTGAGSRSIKGFDRSRKIMGFSL